MGAFKRLREIESKVDYLNSGIGRLQDRLYRLENPPKYKPSDDVFVKNSLGNYIRCKAGYADLRKMQWVYTITGSHFNLRRTFLEDKLVSIEDAEKMSLLIKKDGK